MRRRRRISAIQCRVTWAARLQVLVTFIVLVWFAVAAAVHFSHVHAQREKAVMLRLYPPGQEI